MHPVYNRAVKETEDERIYGESSLNFAYNTKLGNALSFLLLKRKFVSRLVAKKYRSKNSAKMIPEFVEKYGIDLGEQSANDFSSFNDFFTRKQNRDIDEAPGRLIAPADSRLLVKKIDGDTVISVKGYNYTAAQLLQHEELARKFENGTCLVFRLCPTDYHRYCFPDNGTAEETKVIDGKYDSVNTFFVKDAVHTTNYRELTMLHTEHFGDIAYMEVGAMIIGKITPTFKTPGNFEKGEEKGYFEYGASTVIMLLEKDAAEIDEDILNQSEQGIETLVKYGEGIGRKRWTVKLNKSLKH